MSSSRYELNPCPATPGWRRLAHRSRNAAHPHMRQLDSALASSEPNPRCVPMPYRPCERKSLARKLPYLYLGRRRARRVRRYANGRRARRASSAPNAARLPMVRHPDGRRASPRHVREDVRHYHAELSPRKLLNTCQSHTLSPPHSMAATG